MAVGEQNSKTVWRGGAGDTACMIKTKYFQMCCVFSKIFFLFPWD